MSPRLARKLSARRHFVTGARRQKIVASEDEQFDVQDPQHGDTCLPQP